MNKDYGFQVANLLDNEEKNEEDDAKLETLPSSSAVESMHGQNGATNGNSDSEVLGQEDDIGPCTSGNLNGQSTLAIDDPCTSDNISQFGAAHQDLNGLNINYYPIKFDFNLDKSHLSCFRGTLNFSLRYDYIHRVLMLHLIQASHLPSKTRKGSSDPYVKIYMLPDRRTHYKTKIHYKTLNPEFNEMFSFPVLYASLCSKMLQFTVYDYDRMSRHDLIGTVIMRDMLEKSDLYTWTEYNLHIIASNEKEDYGDLLLYMCYHPQVERVQVTVVKAYNLRPMDITGASDPYVKIYHVCDKRRYRKQKTSTKRANLNPVYNELMGFDIKAEHIGSSNLLLLVMDWDRIGSNDLLGCAIIGPDSPTQEGQLQWAEAIQHPGRAVGKWHSLLADIPKSFANLPKA